MDYLPFPLTFKATIDQQQNIFDNSADGDILVRLNDAGHRLIAISACIGMFCHR